MKIDLGMSYDDAMTLEMTKERPEHYPDFTYEGPKELDLPEEGVMKIRYKKIRSSETKRGETERHSCTVEVREILDIEADEDETPTRRHNDAEKSLDDLMAKKMKKGY